MNVLQTRLAAPPLGAGIILLEMVQLYIDAADSSMEDEGLSAVLHVAPFFAQLLYRTVARLAESSVVQREVYIGAAHVRIRRLRINEDRSPSPDHDDVVMIFSKKTYELAHHRAGCFDAFPCIVPPWAYQSGPITLSMIRRGAHDPAWRHVRLPWHVVPSNMT